MKPSLDILRGELERLFSTSALNELCLEYLGVDPEKEGIADGSKAVYVRKLMDWCTNECAVEALADAVSALKKGMVDPRVKQIYTERFIRGESETVALDGMEIGDEILSDGVGALYSCKKESDPEKELALWVISSAHAVDRVSVRRFLMAMQILNSVESESVPKAVDSGMLEDGRPYAVLEWADGKPLAGDLPLSMGDALNVAEALVGALESIHGKGMAHGDLRAENIWLVDSGDDAQAKIKLLGLGSSRLFNNSQMDPKAGCLGATGMVKAMSPEGARGDDLDESADVYGLGAFLYELVTGKPVYTGRAPADVLAAHLTKEPTAPSAVVEAVIPGALDTLVRKLMSREKSGRPKSMDEVRKDLAEVRRAAEELEARAAQTGTREDIETWADALLDNPADAEMLDELKNEARRCNAWGAAVEVMEEAALASDDKDVSRRLLMAAAESATKFAKNYEKAEEIYSQLGEESDDDELKVAVMDLLRAQGKYDELVEKLAAKAEAMEDAAEKIGVIRDIAKVYEENVKDYGKAFDYYQACLGSGDDKDVVSRLEKLAEKTDRFADLATSCGSAAQAMESAGNEDMTVFYYGKLGEWYLERLDQATYALSCYQKVLEHKPAHVGTLMAVADLYRGAQQWSELAGVLVRIGEAESVPESSRNKLAEAARVYYEKLSETDTARDLLVGVLDEDPGHGAAAELLGKIYESEEDWKKLSGLLSGAVEAMPAGPEQASARHRLGELFEDRLDDTKAAKEQYEKAVEMDSKHLDSIKGLERLYAREGDFAGLKGNLEAQLEIAVTPKQRMLLLERLAEINEEEFRNLDDAIDCYKQVLEIDEENRAAMIALTRHFRKTERYEELVEMLKKRAEASEDDEEKNELLSERAEIIRDEIKDAARAAEAFQAVATLGGDSALESLAKTQMDAGNYEAAFETLNKICDAAETDAAKVASLVRMAKLQLEKMDDAAEAAKTLARAKDLAPEDRSVMNELTNVLVAQGNYSAALGVLEEELDLVEGSLSRAEVFARMGVIALEKIGDEDKAINFFERALELDKNNLAAGDNVSTLYRKRGEWEKAFPIYEIWAASADALEPAKQLELFFQTGEALVHTNRHEDAIKYFQKAAAVADEPKLMKRLGEVALDLGEFDLAKEQLERYADEMGDELSAEEKVYLFVCQGRALLGTDDLNDAAKLARQATVMDAENVDARLLLADIHEKRGDFRGAVEARQKVLDGIADDDERRLELIRDTATILFEKLRDADGAAAMLNQAKETHPEDRDILGDLLKIYYATKRFADVVKVVLAIADLVDDAAQLARYYLTVAKVYRRELKQLDDAVEYFGKALEKDPTLEDAQKALKEILTEKKDWEGLEKLYKKAIAGLAKDAPAEHKLALYEPLSDLLITKMDRVKDGILLLEAISKLDPGNAKWLEKLSDLYGWGPEYADKAVGTHQNLLDINPARVDSFRMLYRIHSGEEEPDKAWCAASMLSLLNQASPEERQFYRDYQPEDVPVPESRMKDDQWTRLLYPNEMNQNISSIFSVISKAISKAKSQEISKYGLNPSDAVDVTKDGSTEAQFVNFAAGTLGVETPPMYLHDAKGSGFQLLDSEPPVLVAGKDAAAMKDRMGLAFNLGQQLALLRPGLFVNRLVSSGTELSAWLLASIKIFVQGLPVPSDLAGAVQERLAPIREGLGDADWERLQGYVQSFVSKAADVNLKRWARSVDHTSDRAGLILCGDVSVAVRMLKEQIKDKAVLSERLKALTLFTVSENHAKLREHLGVALKNG